MPGRDAPVDEPPVRRGGVVDRGRVNMLRGAAVVRDQGTAPYRLGQMTVDLAMRIHRTHDIAAAMQAQQRAVLGASFRHRPQGRHAGRIRLEVIDATRLRRHVARMLEHQPHLIEGHFRIGSERRRPPAK